MFNQRSLSIINLKKHQNEASHAVFNWQVEGLISKLNLTYYQNNLDPKILLCREALAYLMNSRSTDRLFNLSYKEFESFLRDDNITPAFDLESNIILENLFGFERIGLAMDIFIHFYQQRFQRFPENYLGKIREAKQLITLYNELFGSDQALIWLHFEHEFLYYDGKKNKLSDESKLLIEKIFHFVFNQDIKLVAV